MSTPKTLRPGLRQRLTNVLALFGIAAAGFTITAFGAALWWPLDLTSHFRVQYFAGLLVIGVVMWLVRRRRLAGVFLVLGLVNLATIMPLYFSPRAEASAMAGSDACRFVLINVRTENTAHHRVAAEIERLDPDVLVLLEVDRRWLDALADTTVDYPYAVTKPEIGNFGLAVYSRYAMEGHVVVIGASRVPSIVAALDIADHPLTLIATHPVPPVGARASQRRNRALAELGDLVVGTPGPVMVLGDLNATPWSAPFRSLLRASGLRDASRGYGVNATWPDSLPPLRIPIDQCLHSADIRILSEAVGRAVGSDHRPLIVEACLLTSTGPES
jgi:endonuclease/exonuclease/phosphatase (EEP) superfamily protein YafD